MNNRFKVGDKVMISESSEYCGISKNNPKDVEGVITSLNEGESLSHYVDWSDGTRNNYDASDLVKVEEVEEVKEKEKSIYDILVERSTLEVGDIVKVTHEVPSHDLGWSNSWLSGMDRAIGEECIITEAPCSSGVRLGEQGNYYYYPLQSVRLVRKKKINVHISEDFIAEVTEKGIKINNQVVTFEDFDDLVKAVAKMRK
jgi:ribosomal protein S17